VNCYRPYVKTIVIALCNIIELVSVSNTQVILLTICAVGSELHALANIHYVPLGLGVTRGNGPTPRKTQRRNANDVIFAPLISNAGTGEQDYALTGDKC